MLSSDFADLSGEAKRMVLAGADYLHMDVMDGWVFLHLLLFPPPPPPPPPNHYFSLCIVTLFLILLSVLL